MITIKNVPELVPWRKHAPLRRLLSATDSEYLDRLGFPEEATRLRKYRRSAILPSYLKELRSDAVAALEAYRTSALSGHFEELWPALRLRAEFEWNFAVLCACAGVGSSRALPAFDRIIRLLVPELDGLPLPNQI